MFDEDYYMTSLAYSSLRESFRLSSLGIYLHNKYASGWNKDSKSKTVWRSQDALPAYMFMDDPSERKLVVQKLLSIASITDRSKSSILDWILKLIKLG